jgi:hypothetical protein
LRGGVEVRFQGGPDETHGILRAAVNLRNGVLVHDVRVLELDDGTLVDETTVLTVDTWEGPVHRIISPPAHGRGWAIHDDQSDKRTIWRRPHVPQKYISERAFLLLKWRAERS